MSEDNRPDLYHIVIADDDASIRAFTQANCKTAASQAAKKVDIRAFPDGADAWAYIGALDQPPHLLVTDRSMTVMHGDELIVKARQRFPELPVILASGDWSLKTLAEKLKVDFLVKPYNLKDLAEKVRQYAPKA